MGKRQAEPTRSLAYLHGCNGSGKSTLARHLIMCSGGIKKIEKHPRTGAYCTYTKGTLALVGKYTRPTGGADGVSPYASVPLTAIALLKDGHDVLIEGLMSPGVQTCSQLYKDALKAGADYVRFIRLDIGYYPALQNVLYRRKLAGNDKPFDPRNVRKKQQSCDGWLVNLAAAKLPVYGLDWGQAKDVCQFAFRVTPDGATGVFE